MASKRQGTWSFIQANPMQNREKGSLKEYSQKQELKVERQGS